MQDQLNFGSQYVSEAAIIREHMRQVGSKGGRARSQSKIEAARRNVAKARATRLEKIQNRDNS